MMGGGNSPQFVSSHTKGSWSGSVGSIPNSSQYRRGSGSDKVCLCGLRMVVRRSKTTANPNRPFYGCPKYKAKNDDHCDYFCWVDNGAEDSGIGSATELATKATTEVTIEPASRATK